MNLIGKRFGKLYVIEKTNEKAKNNGEYKYMCVCDCGKKIKYVIIIYRGVPLEDVWLVK